MWLTLRFRGLLYLVVPLRLGRMTLRNGHGWLFFFVGRVFPLPWLIGAVVWPAAATGS
jgi:hypothetical protein